MTTTTEPKVLTGTAHINVRFIVPVFRRDGHTTAEGFRQRARIRLRAEIERAGWDVKAFTVGSINHCAFDPPPPAEGETGESK